MANSLLTSIRSNQTVNARRAELAAKFANLSATRNGSRYELTQAGVNAAVDFVLETGDENLKAVFKYIVDGNNSEFVVVY